MSDFDDLRQVREAKERAEESARQKALEEERRKEEAAQRLQARKTASADNLHGMVVEILEELRDAVYPDLEVRRLGLDSWGIVRETLGDGQFDR